jgi:hypothetical protein
MKKIFKVLLALLLVYIGIVFVFWFAGICPKYKTKYIDLMPGTVGYPSNEKKWVKVLSDLKLCPFSEKVY